MSLFNDVLTQEGKEKLKSEIRERANEALKRQEIKRVYFTQFVVQ